jgi:hypothetical protein
VEKVLDVKDVVSDEIMGLKFAFPATSTIYSLAELDASHDAETEESEEDVERLDGDAGFVTIDKGLDSGESPNSLAP